MSHQLIVLPDDTAKPILDAINGAKSALNIRMFLFTDETLLAAVIAAKQRGVKVRVMLNPARRSGESENEAARTALLAAGIEVRDSNPKFELTHQKSMVVDNQAGFIESLNWEPRDLTETRDYAVVTTHGLETKEMVDCFDADWEHKDFTPHPESRLIWCPDNGRPRVAAFIDGATHSLWVQNERYQDTVIIERLVRAATRGVKIHILTKPPHSLKAEKLIEGVGGLRILQDVGAKVHTMKHLKLHAKMMLADGKRAIVGSINLAPGSFDGRRELAIETDDRATVQRLEDTARRDWESSHKIDLSDAGLLHDLQKRQLDPSHLVLDGSGDPVVQAESKAADKSKKHHGKDKH
ncbi:phospholipase D-like domain-containing protein [Variovorax sp. J22P168]|uniref:phospholipase D-like domain-containing protein n=1 Tax=Variovorax jilinensis TaxID=3053513 RepID=UPI002578C33A|nr:phospholipase D-like domain-containing protein [Variovorax sp. J22P168]MDM0013321.1 phospholipase D-like domain-containing protein [Variovorax sp. J22P168]